MDKNMKLTESQPKEVMFIPVFALAGIAAAIYLTIAEGGSFKDFVTGMMLLGACGLVIDKLVWFARKMSRLHDMHWPWTKAAAAAGIIYGLFFSGGEETGDLVIAAFGTTVLLLPLSAILDSITTKMIHRRKRNMA